MHHAAEGTNGVYGRGSKALQRQSRKERFYEGWIGGFYFCGQGRGKWGEKLNSKISVYILLVDVVTTQESYFSVSLKYCGSF